MKIYLVQKNADMTEGRGPMINDKCFLHRENAAKYVDNKEGCMGRKAKWSEHPDDWRIVEIELADM